MANVVTLERAKADASACRYLFEDEYRLLTILLVAKADGWVLDADASAELERLIQKTAPED